MTRRDRAHPRSRGENHYEYAEPSNIKGSSPLTRGKPDERRGHALGAGLIPAHAGKTRCLRGLRGGRGAHPRSRGENAAGIASVALTQGSSPLTRGKQLRLVHAVCHGGLIPAHAGKTGSDPDLPVVGAAHPRSRGENGIGPEVAGDRCGSSPLTRGKLSVNVEVRVVSGLIPAHAGKTVVIDDPLRWGRAHPRSRGENTS